MHDQILALLNHLLPSPETSLMWAILGTGLWWIAAPLLTWVVVLELLDLRRATSFWRLARRWWSRPLVRITFVARRAQPRDRSSELVVFATDRESDQALLRQYCPQAFAQPRVIEMRTRGGVWGRP